MKSKETEIYRECLKEGNLIPLNEISIERIKSMQLIASKELIAIKELKKSKKEISNTVYKLYMMLSTH